jgi:Calx-beta domain
MSTKRFSMTVGLLALIVAVIGVAVPTASGTGSATFKPVIGKPVMSPALAQAGKRFVVTFKVTRSDTGKALTAGRMICDPSVAGKVIAHAESFRGGAARLSFVIPRTAQGKLLTVKVTIKAGTQSATRVATFKVAQLPKPSVALGDASVAEGNTGTTTLSFPVTLSAAAVETVSVHYTTSDGAAAAGSDYTAASGTLTFNAGEKAKTISVSVIGELLVEQDETFTLTLSNPVNATLGTATATGTIRNDDVAAANPGHYNGPISSGGNIDFDVAADGHTVSGMTMLIYVSCDNGRAGLLSVRWPGTVPIAPDLSFDASGHNQDLTLTVALKGKFDTATTSAAGTLQVQLKYGGASCATDATTWTANRK